MKAIITVIGKDKVGIIAKVSNFLMEKNVNIEDISQTVLQDYFCMFMMSDIGDIKISVLAEELNKLGEQTGVSIRIQREDIFQSMHRI